MTSIISEERRTGNRQAKPDQMSVTVSDLRENGEWVRTFPKYRKLQWSGGFSADIKETAEKRFQFV